MPTKRRSGSRRSKVGSRVATITYNAKRKNIPPAGLEAQGEVRETPTFRHHYNPDLPPVLRSAPDAAATDALPELLRDATRRGARCRNRRPPSWRRRYAATSRGWSGKGVPSQLVVFVHQRTTTRCPGRSCSDLIRWAKRAGASR